MLLLNIIKAEFLKYKRLYGVKILIFLSLFIVLVPTIAFDVISEGDFKTFQKFFDVIYNFMIISSLLIIAYISDLLGKVDSGKWSILYSKNIRFLYLLGKIIVLSSIYFLILSFIFIGIGISFYIIFDNLGIPKDDLINFFSFTGIIFSFGNVFLYSLPLIIFFVILSNFSKNFLATISCFLLLVILPLYNKIIEFYYESGYGKEYNYIITLNSVNNTVYPFLISNVNYYNFKYIDKNNFYNKNLLKKYNDIKESYNKKCLNTKYDIFNLGIKYDLKEYILSNYEAKKEIDIQKYFNKKFTDKTKLEEIKKDLINKGCNFGNIGHINARDCFDIIDKNYQKYAGMFLDTVQVKKQCEAETKENYEKRENMLSFSIKLSNIDFKNYFLLIFKDLKHSFYIWLFYMILLLGTGYFLMKNREIK